MVKKSTLKSKKHIQRTDSHWVVRRSLISYAVVVFILFATLCMSIFLIDRLVVNKQHADRYDKIVDIYQSLNLGDSYREVSRNVFGDVRKGAEAGRTEASTIEYGHDATPSETAADLRKKIEGTGFEYVQTEYEESLSPIYEFKNSDGEWIRARITSAYNHHQMMYGLFDGTGGDHRDEAPSYVWLSVNLDDNNE